MTTDEKVWVIMRRCNIPTDHSSRQAIYDDIAAIIDAGDAAVRQAQPDPVEEKRLMRDEQVDRILRTCDMMQSRREHWGEIRVAIRAILDAGVTGVEVLPEAVEQSPATDPRPLPRWESPCGTRWHWVDREWQEGSLTGRWVIWSGEDKGKSKQYHASSCTSKEELEKVLAIRGTVGNWIYFPAEAKQPEPPVSRAVDPPDEPEHDPRLSEIMDALPEDSDWHVVVKHEMVGLWDARDLQAHIEPREYPEQNILAAIEALTKPKDPAAEPAPETPTPIKIGGELHEEANDPLPELLAALDGLERVMKARAGPVDVFRAFDRLWTARAAYGGEA